MWLSLFLIKADRSISNANVDGERREAEHADSTERRLNIDHLRWSPAESVLASNGMNLQEIHVYI